MTLIIQKIVHKQLACVTSVTSIHSELGSNSLARIMQLLQTSPSIFTLNSIGFEPITQPL